LAFGKVLDHHSTHVFYPLIQPFLFGQRAYFNFGQAAIGNGGYKFNIIFTYNNGNVFSGINNFVCGIIICIAVFITMASL
jgi:large-conductance mechanosensitive channel